MVNLKLRSVAALAACLLLAGCSSMPPAPGTLVGRCYSAADALIYHMDPEVADCADCILVATLVDVNNLDATTMLGRELSNFLASRMTQRGHTVIQTTLRADHVVIHREGQFLLSRNMRNLATDYKAKSVLVGEYGVTDCYVYVSLRLVSTSDHTVITAMDLQLPIEDEIRAMLRPASPRGGGWSSIGH